MESEKKQLPELTDEQWAAGREIAKDCDIGEEILDQKMLWNDSVATVGYGLAHSAHHIEDFLGAEAIRTAVFEGIAKYQALGDLGGSC